MSVTGFHLTTVGKYHVSGKYSQPLARPGRCHHHPSNISEINVSRLFPTKLYLGVHLKNFSTSLHSSLLTCDSGCSKYI